MENPKIADEDQLPLIVFLHGTHTSFDSKWMLSMESLLNSSQFCVVRYKFSDSYKNNTEYSDQSPQLAAELAQYLNKFKNKKHLIIMGKSLGAKVAVEYALSCKVSKLILLGYPMTYRTNQIREERLIKLNSLTCPVQIIQGENDKYGRHSVVKSLEIKKTHNIDWVKNTDHSFIRDGESSINNSDLKLIQSILNNFLN